MAKQKKDKRTAYEKEVDRLYKQLASIEDQGSIEYKSCLASLKTLTEVECEKIRSKPRPEWPEMIKPVVIGAIGIVEILTILACEKEVILPNKVLNLVLRGRV